MAPAVVRKTSTKVVNGEVRTKSRFTKTTVHGYTIRKLPPGRGFMHVVSPRQLEEFIEIIPSWKNLSHRLGYIELASGYLRYFGLQTSTLRSKVGIIALHAWPKELWTPLSVGFFQHHRHIFEALQVPYEIKTNEVICRFTVAQARAFSLLHVFLHELGHHQDWLRRRGPGLPDKEAFADDFANQYFEELLPVYVKRFGDPRQADQLADENPLPWVLGGNSATIDRAGLVLRLIDFAKLSAPR